MDTILIDKLLGLEQQLQFIESGLSQSNCNRIRLEKHNVVAVFC